jgi:CHAT domain-containing protein
LASADRLAMLYNWPEAAPLYAQAESLLTLNGDTKNALSAKLGYILATADAGVSERIVKEVSTYLQEPLVQADSNLMLRGLVAKAALDSNANETAARASWEQILQLARRVGDKRWEARAKAEIGQVLYMDGDVTSAATMLRDAIISQYLRLDVGAAIHYTAMVGNGFVEAGQPEAGLKYCNIALKATSLVPDRGFPYLAYQGKARALLALHRDAEAQAVVNAALVRAREERNYLALTQLLVVAGTAEGSSHSRTAIQHLKEANEISREKGFHHVFAWSALQLAHVYRDAGDLDDAEALAATAIDVMRTLEDRYHLPEHLALLADIEVGKGKFEIADQLYSEATDVLNALLVNVTRRQLKSSLIATLSDAYVGHFKLAATKFADPEKAYQIIEEARGRSLADTLRGESESLSASPDEVSIDARKEINRIQIALTHETTRETRQALLDQLFVQEQLLLPVRRSSPPLDFAGDHPKPASLRTVQKSLQPDEMVLEYVLGKSESYCLQLTHTDIAVHVIPSGKNKIESLVEDFLMAVRSKQPENTASTELFSLLLQPAIERNSRMRIIIVPDGKLHLLPFDGLKNEKGDYVLESHIVTYAPSATVLYLLTRSRGQQEFHAAFLGIGDVISPRPPSASRATISTKVSANSGADFFDLEAVRFPDLPGSRQEVMSVSAIIRGPKELLLRADATEAAFKSLRLADFEIIHFAVHAVANTKFPDRAALVLSKSPESMEDGLLQVREIRDLPLSAELVVLSACDTGNGRLLGEEGIASLERAFLLAGAKSVIASLWTADDTFTVALMKRFYQHLVEGSHKDSALREAKLDLIEEFGDQALPLYWAGFTLIGDGSSQVFN